LAGDDPFPLKSWLQVTYPLLKAASFDTFCLVAPQTQEIEKEVQLHLTRARHGFSNEPSTKVLNAKGPTGIGSTCVAHASPHSAAAVTSLRH